ncbi:3'-5' exonuclease [Novosphingobium decolorationis]|uniref:DNA 3'-5' helicase n=1 Tax=Novosphingobium decolorationis TaxID=2698673 RepID=A0ABX8E900_9SPHN|nr:3'-5' exonuclease [Novosphingobium decolorationis]QVM85258.1 UvrD-helicase domain-containing protein [Novosphingobium decolorationis]
MNLLWSSTFTDALGKLAPQEQKQVKLTATDLLFDPKGNGIQLHRVEKTQGLWTARVSQDLRIVLHKDGDHTLLVYVGHHDEAYRWAERRKLVQHERTGAMQIVELVERVEERLIYTDRIVEGDHGQPLPAPKPFAGLSDDQLLDVGVPRDWLEPVQQAPEASVDGLFDSLPDEAAEALLDFLTGGRLEDHVAVQAAPGSDPYTHPDAQRRFRVLENVEELQAALDQPFEKWAVFLHPAQRSLAERDWSGPARVTGSAGTGKTIVALHRAVHIAREQADARVLLTTFSKPLAVSLGRKFEILTEAEPSLREKVQVRTLDQAVYDLHTKYFGQPSIAKSSHIRAAIADAIKAGLGAGLTPEFLFEEWDEVVDAWNVTEAGAYAVVPRIGRRTRLGPQQRDAAWSVFEFVRERLEQRAVMTWSQVFARVQSGEEAGQPLGYTHVVVDEAQDLSVAQVKFLGAISKGQDDALFLAGDIGQRIFHLPFSWTRLGLDIRGRSHALKVNYRTSHQIRSMADKLLPATIADMDGIEEGRRGTVSIFDGPDPRLLLVESVEQEQEAVAKFILECLDAEMTQAEIGVLVRGDAQLGRARDAVRAAGLDVRDDAGVAIATMHEAKGLEFRAVVVMACDEHVVPDSKRLAMIGDVADLEAAFETERHLLYVACTRARDRLLVTGLEPGSEFLDDLTSRS